MEILREIDLYTALYLTTLGLHLALVSFPLGGTVLLSLFEIFRGEETARLGELISDYLALSIGLAITAGVAPLLFLEIIHPQAFYNAGAILGPWRPLVLLPLVIAFYLAYLQKTRMFRGWPGIARLPLRLVSLVSLCAVGVQFTVGRRVGEEAELWHERYLDLPIEQLVWDALPLLGLVLAAATIGCSIGTLWLLGRRERRGRLSPGERFSAEDTLLRLAVPTTVGLAVACELLRHRQGMTVDLDWWVVRVALLVIVAGFGVRLYRVGPGRLLATLGAAALLGGVLLLREEQRWLRLGEERSTRTAELAAERGGMIAFIVSLVIAVVGIGLVLRLVGRAPVTETEEDGDGSMVEVLE